MRGLGRLRRTAKRIRNFFFPGSLVLIYHRVAESDLDPFGLAVSPRHFAEQMDVVRRLTRPRTLADFGQSVRNGKVPTNSVVVTFDDGYADNLHSALPILRNAGVPATVFIASGFIGDGQTFWWDDLGDILLRPGPLPARLEWPSDLGKGEGIDLNEARDFGEDDASRWARWTFAAGAPPTARHQFYLDLYFRIQRLLGDAPRRAIHSLREWAGHTEQTHPEARALTGDELNQLASDPLIEIGAHTRHHPLLPSLTTAEQQDEIRSGRREIVERLGRRVHSFSFPYGQYTPETLAIVEGEGFDCSLAADGASVRRGTRSSHALPRVWPGDWDGDEFARRLRAWQASE